MRNATKVCSVHLADMNMEDVSNTLCALGKLAYRDEKFAKKLCSVVLRRPTELNTPMIVNSWYGFCSLRIMDDAFRKQFLEIIFSRQHKFTPDQAVTCLYAFALNDIGRAIARAKTPPKSARKNLPDGGVGQEILNAATQELSKEEVQIMEALLLSANKGFACMSIDMVRKLQIFDLYLRLEHHGLWEGLCFEGKALLTKVRRVRPTEDERFLEKHSSNKSHHLIGKFMVSVGLLHRSDVLVGPFTLHKMVGDRTVFEISSTVDYYRDTSMRSIQSLAKIRLLHKMGFKVVCIPTRQWEQCGNRKKKLLYMASLWQHILPPLREGDKEIRVPDMQDLLTLMKKSGMKARQLIEAGDEARAPSFYQVQEVIKEHEVQERILEEGRARGESSGILQRETLRKINQDKIAKQIAEREKMNETLASDENNSPPTMDDVREVILPRSARSEATKKGGWRNYFLNFLNIFRKNFHDSRLN